MAKFIGVHKMGGPVTEEMFGKSWESYKAAAEKRGLKPLRVNYSAEKGVGFCETEANSIDEVKAAHEDVGVIPEEIVEVKTSE